MSKIKKALFVVGAAALALALTSVPAHANVIITDSTQQSGYAAFNTATPTPLTGVDPWDFGASANLLGGISIITVTLRVYDGDTAPGDFDYNDLTLGLDGIDTGLLLNGFANNVQLTLTLDISNPGTAAAVFAALLADGKLVGTIIDRDPGDNYLELPDTFGTSLTLEGPAAVPEPGTLALLGGGLTALAARRRRRQ